MREEGFKGTIKVISKEPHLPIDRTKISKALISDPSKIALRSADFYKKLQVEFVLDVEATSLDFEKSEVKLSNGNTESYENLILATGANPIRLPLDGADLGNVFLLRGVKDAEAISKALGEPEKDEDKKNVVIIGSSFIGMEAAVAASGKANVTVVGMDNIPFEKILGEKIGQGIKKVSSLSLFRKRAVTDETLSIVPRKQGYQILPSRRALSLHRFRIRLFKGWRSCIEIGREAQSRPCHSRTFIYLSLLILRGSDATKLISYRVSESNLRLNS